jgi:REP element-mobilizing transposase RayT
MANTYTKIYIHFVFAVKNRQSLIRESIESELYKYISGIVEKNGHKLMTINGVADHIHLFVSMNPKQSPSDLMYNVKKSSSRWINSETSFRKFNWQEGFGAFSYSESQKNNVVQYIN